MYLLLIEVEDIEMMKGKMMNEGQSVGPGMLGGKAVRSMKSKPGSVGKSVVPKPHGLVAAKGRVV